VTFVEQHLIGVRSDCLGFTGIPRKFKYKWGFLILTGKLDASECRKILTLWRRSPENLFLRSNTSLRKAWRCYDVERFSPPLDPEPLYEDPDSEYGY